jgi:protoporphyrinogen/coproporphyrinogen III oxidase
VNKSSVVIVGGGITALAAAYELSGGVVGPTDNTPRIEIIEASPLLGGALQTTAFGDRLVDLGPDGFLVTRPEATQLARDLGIAEELVSIAASGASILLNGKLHELPKGLMLGVPTDRKQVDGMSGLSKKARKEAKRDWKSPRKLRVGDDISIGSILANKLGDELAYQLIEPMIGGIQAGRINELSAKAVFPALYNAAKQGGSIMKNLAAMMPATPSSAPVFMSLRQGVGSFPHVLEAILRERKVIIRTNTPVTRIRPVAGGTYQWEVDTENTTTSANAVIMATPASITGHLTAAIGEALATLQKVRTAPTAMITFEFATESLDLPEHGTGILVPLHSKWTGRDSLLTTAITFLDRKWPNLKRPDMTLVRVHVGRSDDQRYAKYNDEELSERILKELAFILGESPTPLRTVMWRFDVGLPQYAVGHQRLVAAARELSEPMNMFLAGNSYDGVGIPASIGSGRLTALQVLRALA